MIGFIRLRLAEFRFGRSYQVEDLIPLALRASVLTLVTNSLHQAPVFVTRKNLPHPASLVNHLFLPAVAKPPKQAADRPGTKDNTRMAKKRKQHVQRLVNCRVEELSWELPRAQLDASPIAPPPPSISKRRTEFPLAHSRGQLVNTISDRPPHQRCLRKTE